MTERHAKHPGPPPLARARIQRRRATEKVDLGFGAWGAVKHANGTPRRGDRPHEPLHRFVAGPVTVLLDEVLPDPLQAQTGIELLGDGRPIGDGGEAWAR